MPFFLIQNDLNDWTRYSHNRESYGQVIATSNTYGEKPTLFNFFEKLIAAISLNARILD